MELSQKVCTAGHAFLFLYLIYISKSYFEGGLGLVPCEQDAWALSVATTILDNVPSDVHL